MNIYPSIKVSLVFFALALYTGCVNREKNELAHDHAHEHGHSHAHNEHDGNSHDHDSEDDDAIVIEPEKAEKLGIEVMKVEPALFNPAIKVSGEVSAPPSSRHTIAATTTGIITLGNNIKVGSRLSKGTTIGAISGNSIAGGDVTQTLKLEYESAKAEYERVKPLYEQGIVSTKNFNEIKNNFERAKLALGNVGKNNGNTLVSPAAGTLVTLSVSNGDYVEAGQTIGTIGDNSTLTFKADLPKRYHSLAERICDVYIIPSCGDCDGFSISDQQGRRLDGNIGVSDNVTGFYPVYFSFTNNGSIEGSGYVDAYLLLNEDSESIAVPQSALVEQQGQWFVYIRLDEDCYEKRPVTIGGSNGKEVEIKSGIKPGEEVVVKGVTFVKLAESAGVVPEGHSHTH